MSRRRSVGVVVAVLLGILLAVWAVQAGFFDARSGWTEVELAPFVRRIEASGELRSANSISVGPPQIRRMWRFTVTSMAQEGKAIEEGQPLVGFDAQDPMERLEVKSSNLETARKEYEKTELETLERLEALILEQVELKAKRTQLSRKLDVPEEQRSRLELEKLKLEAALAEREIALTARRIEVQRRNREARVQAAKQRVATLEKEVGRIQADIGRMTVPAPRSGFVVHVSNWRGEKVEVGQSIYYGQELLEIADLDQMELAAEIAEPDAGRVEVGQQAEIVLDAAPDRTFTGVIRRLGRLFRTKSWESPTRVFDAVITIDDPDSELMRPGMAASVTILSPSRGEVIQVPEEVIHENGSGPRIVARRGNGKGRSIPVVLGERYEGKVVIREGLQPGDRYRAEPEAGSR
jgi:RND family efflux transporter MFP subunit